MARNGWRDSGIGLDLIRFQSCPMPESRQPRDGIPLDYPFCAIREIYCTIPLPVTNYHSFSTSPPTPSKSVK